MFQTLGFVHPRYMPRLKTAAGFFAFVIFCGFVSIPIAVVLRIVPQIL
jgi:hypothetical protein